TVVLVVAGAALRFGIPVYRQQQAIREIEALGGNVTIIEGGPDWLRVQVGDEWMKVLDDVVSVQLDSSRITDAGLVHLMSLTKLETLDLDNTQVTDAGLEHLTWLTRLKY